MERSVILRVYACEKYCVGTYFIIRHLLTFDAQLLTFAVKKKCLNVIAKLICLFLIPTRFMINLIVILVLI